MDFRLRRGEAGQDAREPQGLLAERRPNPVVPGCGGIALVENQVDDLQHRSEASLQLRTARDLERHALPGKSAFGSNDALRDSGLRDEKRARDFVGRETAQEPQRQRDTRLRREHGMARGEDQPQQVIPDVIVEGGVELVGHVVARGLISRPISSCFRS